MCLHAGGSDRQKRWPVERFAQVADGLAAQGWRVVLTGNEAESPLVSRLASRMRRPALHAACDLSIGALAALLSRARLLVSNDGGPVPVAVGLGLPSVVVAFGTEPAAWAPLDPERLVAIRPKGRAPAAVVLEAALAMLARSPWEFQGGTSSHSGSASASTL